MQKPTRAELEPKAEPIQIRVDKEENFIYEPALLHAKPGDFISWRCEQGEFTVSFPGRSPFDKVTLHSGQDGSTDPQRVREPVEPGVYHYHVAVAVKGKDTKGPPLKVVLDSGCPGIEVSR